MASKRKPRKHSDFPKESVKSSASPYTENVVARIIKIATRGKGLNRRVVLPVTEAGQSVVREFAAQDGLKLRLDGAIRYAAYSREWRARTRTDGELVSMFSKIERSARGLLLALQVSKATDDLPIPAWLHHGGLHWQAANDLIAAERSASRIPAGAQKHVVGVSLIRDAIDGIGDIARWANKALQHLERKIQTNAERADQEARLPDDPYREWVNEMASIWLDIFARADTNSRAFGDFVAESGAAIDLRLDGDALRHRVPNAGRAILRSLGKTRRRRKR